MVPGSSDSSATLTSWLVRWSDGDPDALEKLTGLVYAELHRVAAILFSQERDGHTLQATALVHELYLRLPAVREIDWKCRAQFFSLAARMMRNILVDHARGRQAGKRGAAVTVSMGALAEEPESPSDLVLVDAALVRFAQRYPRQAQVVELRFFGGLTAEETAQTMNAMGQETSPRTVDRDWRFSKAWLQNELGSV